MHPISAFAVLRPCQRHPKLFFLSVIIYYFGSLPLRALAAGQEIIDKRDEYSTPVPTKGTHF